MGQVLDTEKDYEKGGWTAQYFQLLTFFGFLSKIIRNINMSRIGNTVNNIIIFDARWVLELSR